MRAMRVVQLLLLLSFCAVTAQAQIPKMINYQGVLLDDSNQVVVDSSYYMTFRIYSDSIAGSLLYTFSDTLDVANGVFNVLLGETTIIPATVFNTANTWIETEVAPQAAFSPRKRIASVPYAYKALSSAREAGGAQAVLGNSSVWIDSLASNMLTRSINCPDSGYVLVIGTCQPRYLHTTGFPSSGDYGVSSISATLPLDQDHNWNVLPGQPSGTYFNAVTAQKIFLVGPGANTFYFVGQKTDGNASSHAIWDLTLSLLYFRESYGTVSESPPMTSHIEKEALRTTTWTGAGATAEVDDVAARLQFLEREIEELRALIGADSSDNSSTPK